MQHAALRLAVKHGLIDKATVIRRRLANTYQETGSYGLAEKLLDECRPPDDANAETSLTWHNASAILAERRGFIGTAERHYDRAVALLPEGGHERTRFAAVLSNAALIKVDLGKLGEAKDLAKQLSCAAGRHAPLSARLGELRLKAAIAEAESRFLQAASLWQKIMDLAGRETGGDSAHHLDAVLWKATCLEAAGRKEAAVDLLETELAFARGRLDGALPPDATGIATWLGRHRLFVGDADSAYGLLAETAVIEATRGNIPSQVELFAGLAEVAGALGEVEAAILLGKMSVHFLTQSVADLSITREASKAFLSVRLAAAKQLITRLIDSGRIPEAVSIPRIVQDDRFADAVLRDATLVAPISEIPMRDGEVRMLGSWCDHCAEMMNKQAETADWRMPVAARNASQGELNKRAKRTRAVVSRLMTYGIGTQRVPGAPAVASPPRGDRGRRSLRRRTGLDRH